MLFYYHVIVIEELNKWLSTMCWSNRASLLMLIDKRLVRKKLAMKRRGKAGTDCLQHPKSMGAFSGADWN